jgi:hypothetical protein
MVCIGITPITASIDATGTMAVSDATAITAVSDPTVITERIGATATTAGTGIMVTMARAITLKRTVIMDGTTAAPSAGVRDVMEAFALILQGCSSVR